MKRIFIVAFRGISAERTNVDALIQAGHVGFRLERERTIYGFHPTTAAIDAAGGQQAAVAALKYKKAVLSGSVQNDTKIFLDAHNLSVEIDAINARIAVGPRFRSPRVWFWYFGVGDERFNTIRSDLKQWFDNQTPFPYAFPPRVPFIIELKQLMTDNCATFPRKLGLPVLPFNDSNAIGQMSDYMDAFESIGERWYPKR